ncbi:hypothetical protein [Vibrio crassostreae]|uniref:hypothetical protein n=1 Tax=Vibrio crassostreae TaxID=246167 RepID=UPI001B3024F6|nr:hypothetical protein [Vibrio crassostreae]
MTKRKQKYTPKTPMNSERQKVCQLLPHLSLRWLLQRNNNNTDHYWVHALGDLIESYKASCGKMTFSHLLVLRDLEKYREEAYRSASMSSYLSNIPCFNYKHGDKGEVCAEAHEQWGYRIMQLGTFLYRDIYPYPSDDAICFEDWYKLVFDA